jgi:hypothetical protein
MMPENLERGTGHTVFTGTIVIPFDVLHRTVVVITLMGMTISWRAKPSPFGHREPITSVPSVSSSQQVGQTRQINRLALLLSKSFSGFCLDFFFSLVVMQCLSKIELSPQRLRDYSKAWP